MISAGICKTGPACLKSRSTPTRLNSTSCIEQLKHEHDARLEDLKAELEAVNRLIEVELRRLATAPAAPKVPAREPVQHHAEPPGGATCRPSARAGTACVAPAAGSVASSTRAAAADFLVRKLNEVGAMSRDDLRRLSLQEGYFADADTADRGVHATLLNVVKAGLIRQLPNGNFAPATVLDTIRLRRAM